MCYDMRWYDIVFYCMVRYGLVWHSFGFWFDTIWYEGGKRGAGEDSCKVLLVVYRSPVIASSKDILLCCARACGLIVPAFVFIDSLFSKATLL